MAVYGENLRSVGGEIVDLEEQGLAVVGPGRHVTGIARNKGQKVGLPRNIKGQKGQKGQQGQQNRQRPWQAMQPIFPAGRGGPTVHDQGMAIGQALNQGMLANQLGTPGFMTGSGTKDDPQVYHPGQGSAHERMVADVNNAWAQYAYQQGQANREKNRLKAIKDIMRMFA